MVVRVAEDEVRAGAVHDEAEVAVHAQRPEPAVDGVDEAVQPEPGARGTGEEVEGGALHRRGGAPVQPRQAGEKGVVEVHSHPGSSRRGPSPGTLDRSKPRASGQPRGTTVFRGGRR